MTIVFWNLDESLAQDGTTDKSDKSESKSEKPKKKTVSDLTVAVEVHKERILNLERMVLELKGDKTLLQEQVSSLQSQLTQARNRHESENRARYEALWNSQSAV